MKDISLGQVVLRLFQVARRFDMQVQPQLILLQKTLLAVEGLGRQLYPDLDLWATAKPFLEKWLKAQVGPKAFIKQLRENMPFFAEQLPHMPRLIFEVLQLSKTQAIQQLSRKEASFDVARERRSWIRGLGSALVVVMAPLALLGYTHGVIFNHLPVFAAGLAMVGGLLVVLNLN